jgi:HEAT repeat protein
LALGSAMASDFEFVRSLSPSALVFKAIVGAIVADGLLLAFILVRRAYRKRYFKQRDARTFELRQKWEALISGNISYQTWRTKPLDRRIVEDMALDAFEAAGPEESARLLRFLRASGLIEKRIFEARRHHGWRRLRALVALGRTRAPEGIPALSEGLRDSNLETRHAALRGLSRLGSPEAAEEILQWVAESGLNVPALPLQSALINCCRERPQVLLSYLRHADGPLREVLARVLGEVASPSVGMELLALADDELPELRAAAPRAISQTQPSHAVETLAELSQDTVWFVRLRAAVALGKLHHPTAIPHLLRGLTDSNRLVRMRAAEALVDFKSLLAQLFAQVVATRDRYGLHAFLAALENAGLRKQLESELSGASFLEESESERLLNSLVTGRLPEAPTVQPLLETSPAVTPR